MRRALRRSEAGKPYGQRAQVGCVIGMIKLKLGDALRSRSTHRRKMELLLKVIVQNPMIIKRQNQTSHQRRT
jgi:hypothetical protein